MKILVQFPTRGRPEKFASTLYCWQHTRTTDMVTFMITIDKNDRTMNNPRTFSQLMQWKNLTINLIEPCGKIGAINSGVQAVNKDYDIIVLASDDMLPEGKGWDKRIIDDMTRLYPDGDGVLWYNDGYTENRLNTLCILGTKYYRRFNYIYQPDYWALWCDNEFMDVANMLGKQTYSPDILFRHEHPANGHGKTDRLNDRDNRFYEIDRKTYEQRKARNFDLVIPTDTDTTGKGGKPESFIKPDKRADFKSKRRRTGSGVHPVGQSGDKYRHEEE